MNRFTRTWGNGIRMVILFLVTILAGTSWGQEFKLTSQVLVGQNPHPMARSMTLFTDDATYEFRLPPGAVSKTNPIGRPNEIVIFDFKSHKTILLDVDRQLKLELLDLRILKILDAIRAETLKDERTQFLVSDEFAEEGNWADGFVRLVSPTMTYTFKGNQPEDTSYVPAYLSYLAASTQLAATNPHKLPPFAKMKLNDSIRKTGWIPSEIQVKIEPNALFPNGLDAKSIHTVTGEFSDADREKIDSAKRKWLQYQSASLAEYRQLPETKRISKLKKTIEDDLHQSR